MTRRIWTGIVSSIGMLLLILDAKTALSGAAEGVELCMRTVIPALLPFFLLSILLTGALTGQRIRLLEPLGRLCGMPAGSESLLILGFLGGYPAGAQAVAQAYRAGQLKKQDAERMLGFCSNAGPSFLFGIIALQFPSQRMVWVLWGIHILSAIAVGMILPDKSKSTTRIFPGRTVNIPEALMQALRIMAGVCGWVIVFRVIIAFCRRWFLWLLPEAAQIIWIGVLELANGCCCLGSITDTALRFVVCSGILAFGGLCVWMQTVSVTAGLGTGWYFPGKLLQALLSICLAWLWQRLMFPAHQQSDLSPFIAIVCGGIFVVSAIILRNKKKSSSIPVPIGV